MRRECPAISCYITTRNFRIFNENIEWRDHAVFFIVSLFVVQLYNDLVIVIYIKSE